MNTERKNIAGIIDHTLLKPDATRLQIDQLCGEAVTYSFASVCVNPFWVQYCSKVLAGTGVAVCTVVGFPLGATTGITKAFEARTAIEHGSQEIDMVINIGALKSDDCDIVENDIRCVRDATAGALLKVIIETCLLDDKEKVKACELSQKAGADFVKTSTGFAGGGATVEDVTLMRRVVGQTMGVKASGGIRTLEDAQRILAAGANRLGTSAGVAIST